MRTNKLIDPRDSKLVGDISVQRTILLALEHNCGVSIPVGDRLPYDLIIDYNSTLIKVQVKTAYQCKSGYSINARRNKTNRKCYKYERYHKGDFDVLIAWLKDKSIYYAIPATIFLTVKSALFVEATSILSTNRSAHYRNVWPLI